MPKKDSAVVQLAMIVIGGLLVFVLQSGLSEMRDTHDAVLAHGVKIDGIKEDVAEIKSAQGKFATHSEVDTKIAVARNTFSSVDTSKGSTRMMQHELYTNRPQESYP